MALGNVQRASGGLPALLVAEAVGNAGEHSFDESALIARLERHPTEDDVLGPYYRRGAPCRAKVWPPLSDGRVLEIFGSSFGSEHAATDFRRSARYLAGKLAGSLRQRRPRPSAGTSRIFKPHTPRVRRKWFDMFVKPFTQLLQNGRAYLALSAHPLHCACDWLQDARYSVILRWGGVS